MFGLVTSGQAFKQRQVMPGAFGEGARLAADAGLDEYLSGHCPRHLYHVAQGRGHRLVEVEGSSNCLAHRIHRAQFLVLPDNAPLHHVDNPVDCEREGHDADAEGGDGQGVPVDAAKGGHYQAHGHSLNAKQECYGKDDRKPPQSIQAHCAFLSGGTPPRPGRTTGAHRCDRSRAHLSA